MRLTCRRCVLIAALVVLNISVITAEQKTTDKILRCFNWFGEICKSHGAWKLYIYSCQELSCVSKSDATCKFKVNAYPLD